MKSLLDIFAQRRLFVNLLLKSNMINLTLAKLIITLETLNSLSYDTIE